MLIPIIIGVSFIVFFMMDIRWDRGRFSVPPLWIQVCRVRWGEEPSPVPHTVPQEKAGHRTVPCPILIPNFSLNLLIFFFCLFISVNSHKTNKFSFCPTPQQQLLFGC